MKIDGKEIAGDIIARLKERETPKKIFAVVFVGSDPRSLSFIKQKEKVAQELGVDFRIYKFGKDLKNDGLRKEIGRIARQKPVGGVVVQLPLPEGVGKRYVLNAVPPEKDVDVLGERALGTFRNNNNPVLPPAVGTVKEILEHMQVNLKEMVVVIVGRGSLVGSPVNTWLVGKTKALYTLDSKSNIEAVKKADIVISGVGKAGLITPSILKDGAGVIDFGYYYFPNGDVSGDLATEDEGGLDKLAFYTPTPGGTGPILVGKLFENFYTLCEKQAR